MSLIQRRTLLKQGAAALGAGGLAAGSLLAADRPENSSKAPKYLFVLEGNGLAMANLGILYRDGLGGERNLSKARSLLTVAVTLGVEGAEPVLRSLGN